MSLAYEGIAPYLPSTAEQIRKTRFTRRGRRGYDAAEVDRFVARMAEDAGWHADTVDRLYKEVRRLREWYRNQGVDTEKTNQLPPRVEREAVDLLTHAQRQADDLMANAQEQARALVTGAYMQRDEIIAAARTEAEVAARHYRRTAGDSYNAAVEDDYRKLAWLQVVDAALQSVRAQLPAVIQQIDAVSGTFRHEMTRLEGQAAEPGRGHLPARPEQPQQLD